MINLFAYGISFLIGFFLIRLILGERTNISFFLHCALSIGLGLGVSAALTFFFLLIYGQFSPAGLIIINLLTLFMLTAANFFYIPKNRYLVASDPTKHKIAFTAATVFVWTIAIVLVSILSQQFPFGGWDAWGLYNTKAKFIVYGANHWTDLVRIHPHTQPSYPLLLPLINAWIFSVFQKNLIEASSMTGVIFCLSCGLLLYAGLALFIKRPIAAIASLLLTTTPSYIFWGTTQYADVLLAYYLLASTILLITTMHTKENRMAFLAGLFWGMMPFAKNEGLVFLVLFLGVTSTSFLLNASDDRQRSLRLIENLAIGAALAAFATIIFKIFLAPATREVLFNPLGYKLKYLNIEGFLTVVKFYALTLLSLGWVFTWGLVFMIAIANCKKCLVVKEALILVIILAGFAASLFYVYLTTAHFDLMWRLECTATRILFYMLPTILFINFYTLWIKPQNGQR